MKLKQWSTVVLTVALVAIGACKSGPPAIKDLKTAKDKEATQPANAFDARDTIYASANLDNPPANGKVTGRLAVVEVEGQPAGPIAGLETTLDLTGGMNKADFTFTPPTNGWPNGKYQLQVVLLDNAGAQKDQKNVDFSTSGNQPAAPAAEATDTASTETTDTGSTAETETQQ